MKALQRFLLITLPDAAAGFGRRVDWAVIAIYLAAFFLYTEGLDAIFVGITAQYFLQYLDTELLRTDLWRSLLYLHSQPPLMNLIIALALKAGGSFDLIMSRLFFVAGLVIVHFTSAAMAELGIRRSLRIAIIAWLCFFPTFMLFGRWLYTPHLELALCSVILYVLARMQHETPIRYASLMKLGVLFCLLGLLRAQWHPAMFAAWLAFLWLLRRRDTPVKDCVRATLITMSPLLLLFMKNAVLFGVPGASSWTGMNFSGVAANSINTQLLRKLQDRGEVSRNFPVYFRHHKAIDVYRKWEKEGRALPRSRHPSMHAKKTNGWDNYNFQAYIEGSRQDMADSLAIVRNHPFRYVRHVLKKMAHITSVPSIAYQCCNFSTRYILKWGKLYSAVDPDMRYWIRRGSVLLYGVVPVVLLLGAFWPRSMLSRQRYFILAGMFIVLGSYVISCAFSNLEQERIRWATVTFYLVYAAMLVEMVLRKFEKKRISLSKD